MQTIIKLQKKIIETDLKRVGTKAECCFYLALITNNVDEKRDLYSKAIEAQPDFLDAYINRGLVFNELGEFEKSIEDYNRAIELDSRCALAYNNRGYTKYKMQDYKGALSDYNKAILLNPRLKIALDNKAKLFLEVCMEDDKDFSEKYYLSIGIDEVRRGQYNEAISTLKECLKYNPNSHLAYFYIGVAYHTIGDEDSAIDSYSKAIEKDKNMIDAYFNRGQLLMKSSPKDALDDFVKAVALDNKFLDAYYSIAVIQKNLGQYKDAVKNLDKIIELEPQAVNAKALKKLIINKYIKE